MKLEKITILISPKDNRFIEITDDKSNIHDAIKENLERIISKKENQNFDIKGFNSLLQKVL